MVLKEKTACFTGHRELKDSPDTLFPLVYKTVEELISQGYLYFGAGGACGFDALASEAVLALKQKYPQIHLILVLPFQNQYEHEKSWSRREIDQYQALKQKASRVVYTQEAYSFGCYYKRNRHLVDFSSVCVCYQYKTTGGTAYTVKYAEEKGLKIIRLWPCQPSSPCPAAFTDGSTAVPPSASCMSSKNN